MKIILLIALFSQAILAEVSYYEYGKKVTLTKVKKSRSVDTKTLMLDTNITYYENSNGQKMGVKNEVIAKCKKDKNCDALFKSLSLTDRKNLTKTMVLFRLNKGQDPFGISTKLSEDAKIEFAHPNFIKKRKKR